MNPPTDQQIIHAMRWYGGSFVRALGEAATCADDENMRRLKKAFPEYWALYSEMAAMELSKTNQQPNQTHAKYQRS